MNKTLDRVTQEGWASCVRHAENLQEQYFAKEIGWDEILEPIIVYSQDSETEKAIKTSDNTYDNNDDDTPLAVPLD
jgi:hypothetical protein